MSERVLAFDMFGTLVDPASYAEGLRSHIPEAESVAASWRRHQLEISWLLSVAEQYRDWSTVTSDALDMALAEYGVGIGERQRADALSRAANPNLFGDVTAALDRLTAEGVRMIVFSNGDAESLRGILRTNEIADRFDAVVSCEEVRVYKPAPVTYRHVAERMGCAIGEVWLVSGNPFDCAGAALAGTHVAEIKRAFTPSYPFAPASDLVLGGLTELADAVVGDHRD